MTMTHVEFFLYKEEGYQTMILDQSNFHEGRREEPMKVSRKI